MVLGFCLCSSGCDKYRCANAVVPLLVCLQRGNSESRLMPRPLPAHTTKQQHTRTHATQRRKTRRRSNACACRCAHAAATPPSAVRRCGPVTAPRPLPRPACPTGRRLLGMDRRRCRRASRKSEHSRPVSPRCRPCAARPAASSEAPAMCHVMPWREERQRPNKVSQQGRCGTALRYHVGYFVFK